MAKHRGKRKTRRLLRWAGRKLARHARRRLRAMRRGATRVFEAKVIRSWSRDGWASEFPDPARPGPLVMHRAEREEYVATFDELLTVEFSVSPAAGADLAEAAQDAAVAVHGPVAASWVLTAIEGTNDAGRAVLAGAPAGVFKP